MNTAEWICTTCNTTNRVLVAPTQRDARDRCVSCRTRHTVSIDDRPVRWTATAAK